MHFPRNVERETGSIGRRGRRRSTVGEDGQPLDRGAVGVKADHAVPIQRIGAIDLRSGLADLQRFEGAEHSPHAHVEMRVEVAVPDDITGDALQVAGAIERYDGMARARSDGDGVDQRRAGIARIGIPLVDVQVKDVGFLDAGMDQVDAHRIAEIRLEYGGGGVAEHPGAVMLLLVDDGFLELALLQPFPDEHLAVLHRLGAVVEAHERAAVGFGRHPVLVARFLSV